MTTPSPDVEWLSLAIQQSPVAVIMTDTAGLIQYVNHRFTAMTGYQPEEVLGQTPNLLKSGLTPPETYRVLWETLKAGEVWRGELCNRRKDGTLYWHSASISPVRNAAGALAGFVAVQEDITERRRTAEALVEQERKYRRIVDTASEGIWQVDLEGRTTFVNHRLASMLGYPLEQILGRPVSDFTDAEGRELLETGYLRCRQGITEQQEIKLQRRDGSALWVLMSTGPILDGAGKYAGALAMVANLTARHEAEQTMRRSELWFRALIEGAEDLIAVLTPAGTFRYASPSFERVLGLRPSDLEGRAAIDFAHPDELAAITEAVRGFREPGTLRRLQFRFRHADGSWRLLDGVGRNLTDDPVVGGTILHGRDITEQTALEHQYRQAQKMEALGRLVGGVAHDFNNLLAVILGVSDLMSGDLTADHPSLKDVAEIRRAGEQAAALTRQLLAFCRKQSLSPVVLDLNGLVRNMEKMLGRILGEDIVLTSQLASRGVMVKADSGQLEQVLMNLAVNSRDAMPKGGRLLIETAVVDVDETSLAQHAVMRPGPHALLTVSDTGCGMDEETRNRVFEPFFTTKGPGKGTGLGLSTVYGIVKQSEGFIWLYSEPGQGTVFKIYLPLTIEEIEKPKRRFSDAPGLRGTETVLVAEDNVQVRQLVRRALERCGYSVMAGTDVEALELARSAPGQVHLLLTDVIMPTIRGPDLARAVARLRPGVRVLYMSGYTDRAAVDGQAVEQGVDYLQKPFTTVLLAQKVREVLDRAPAVETGG